MGTKILYGLLALVPIALVLEVFDASYTVIFLVSAGALIPLAALLGRATEQAAIYTGERIGALLNATLGNAAELIITIVAIREGLLELVKASISGSIIGNILLVLGASLMIGGIKNGSQRFDAHIASLSSTLMTLAIIALVIPAVFSIGPNRIDEASTEFLSIGVAIVLMIIYGLFVYYSIFRHVPQQSGAAVVHEEKPDWSLTYAIGILVVSTIGVVFMSEILIGSVEPVVHSWGVSELFLGVILVPIVGNVAEHLVAVQAAAANKMDLSIGIAIGSSLQIALFVAPVLVFVSLLFGHPMSLVFNEYELAALAGSIVIATLISVDGESNWLEGAQLMAVYLITAMGFFFLS